MNDKRGHGEVLFIKRMTIRSCIDFKGNMATFWGHNGNNISFRQQNVPHEILDISHVFRKKLFHGK